MQITVEWQDETYIVRQDGEYIGDYETLEGAATFAIAVSSEAVRYSEVQLLSVRPS